MTRPTSNGSTNANADRNSDRIVRSWLHEDRHEDATRVLDSVLTDVDTTPQRRSGWTAWRASAMNRFVVVGLGAAAVVAVLLIGSQLLGSPPPGGPGASASSEPTSIATSEVAGTEPPFQCGTPTFTRGRDSTDYISHLTDIRFWQVGGMSGDARYYRFVFQYAESGVPSFYIGIVEPPFTRVGGGPPLEVSGSAVYQIWIHGGTNVDPNGNLTYTGPTDFSGGDWLVSQLVYADDSETWFLGLTHNACMRAFVLTDPSRIVIDIRNDD